MKKRRCLFIQWHITTLCEQRCKHCYVYNSPFAQFEIEGEKRIGWEELKEIADNIKKTIKEFRASCQIGIIGGDPLLHPHFFKLVRYLKSQEMKIDIAGNPWLLTEKCIIRLKQCGIGSYHLSLDGLEEIHDSYRKEGSFKRTIEAIKLLKNYKVPITVMTTVGRENAREVPKIIELVVDRLQIERFSFARFVPFGSVKQDSLFSPKEYREFLVMIWKEYIKRKDSYTQLILRDPLWQLYLWEINLLTPINTKGVMVDGCSVGGNHFTILANGDVYACRRFPSSVGNVLKTNLSDIILSPKFDVYREIEKIEKCKNCFLKYYCRGCRAMAYSQTGKWFTPDPQCWKK